MPEEGSTYPISVYIVFLSCSVQEQEQQNFKALYFNKYMHSDARIYSTSTPCPVGPDPVSNFKDVMLCYSWALII